MRVFSFIPALLLVTISFVAATLAAPTANAVLPNLNATLAGCGSDDNIQQVTNIVTSAINRIKVALAAPDPSGDNSLWRIATSVRIQVQTALKDVREVTENNPKCVSEVDNVLQEAIWNEVAQLCEALDLKLASKEIEHLCNAARKKLRSYGVH